MTRGKVLEPDPNREINGVAIDSRETKPNDLFVCLPGQKTDGHLYLPQAYKSGASASLISSLDKLKRYKLDDFHNLILVAHTTQALHRLASDYRKEFDIPIVGITGSSGKTTTKELLWHMLKQSFNCYRSAGNYNTEYGLPCTLLNMPRNKEIGIFELAMQKKGEIRELCKILKPTCGAITNIGDAHLGFFRNREELSFAKWELVEELPPDGKVILNMDSKFLRERTAHVKKIIGFSVSKDIKSAQFKPSRIDDHRVEGLSFQVVTPKEKIHVNTRLLGKFNVCNILAAISLALELGARPEEVKRGASNFTPVPHRMEKRNWSTQGVILDDTYNANPYSTKKALETLDRLEVNDYRKAFVFGDMMELGDRSANAHLEIGQFISNLDIDFVFTLGKRARETGEYLLDQGDRWQKNVVITQDKDELERKIKDKLGATKNIILIKGSREMKLDKLVDRLAEI